MLLKKLIKNPLLKKQINVTGLTTNSKTVKNGFIFFAIKGQKSNGEKFINEAIVNGAVAIVCSSNCNFFSKLVPVIKTKDVRNYLSEICSKFYNLKPKNIIAVTGTNGKTSVADLFYQILSLNNRPVASIGTLGIKFNGKIIKSELTTPDAISTHKILNDLKKRGIDNVIIEASSHALDQKRINHLNLKAGIFTNFTQDHLDYHKTMKLYLNSKLLLFKKILKEKKIIISDQSLKEFKILKKISKKRNLNLQDISSIKYKLITHSNLILNDFQIKNISMAIAASKLCNLSEKKIFDSLIKIKDINGRLEHIRTFSNNIKVYVDFAHTPDALSKVLTVIKNYQGNKVSLVFGCGGERDVKKRPLMAKIASSNCEKIYVTDDNPRKEKPEKIRNEIIKNIKNKNCFNIGNREKAIKAAIENAEPNEIILVAGKGHETEQIYHNKIFKISDKSIIKKIKFKFKKISTKKQTFLQNMKIMKSLIKKPNLKNFQGVAIDSREVKKGNLFLTIKGKNNDGFQFISNALKKGAKYVVTSKNKKKYKNKIIKIKNEIEFLKNFASKKRILTSAKIIAITGSAGKTSLKNLIHKLLTNFGETLCSPRSYNNQFGVPISLSQLNSTHKYGIFEVGMSKSGEINLLSKIIRPHIGIITNIGEAHIENFKNLTGIAKAKGEIINNIMEGGTLILNRDDKFFSFFEKKAKLRNLKIISFGKNKKADIFLKYIIKKGKKNILFTSVKNQIFKLEKKNLNLYNILSSLAVLKALNLNINKIINIYKNNEPTEGRGKIHNIFRYKKKFKLIDESYNANPLSVKVAIQNFDTIKKQNFKKYLFLGDMLELGQKSEYLHRNLSKVINISDIDKVFIKGTEIFNTYKGIDINKRGNIFQQDDDIDFIFNSIISNNDYLMIKGSNATGLGNFSKKIIRGS